MQRLAFAVTRPIERTKDAAMFIPCQEIRAKRQRSTRDAHASKIGQQRVRRSRLETCPSKYRNAYR